MSMSYHTTERYLITYTEGDRNFAVAVYAPSMHEAKYVFEHMSREDRRRNIVSTMISDEVDLVHVMAKWVRRNFFARATTH